MGFSERTDTTWNRTELTSKQRCKHTTWVDIQNALSKATVTRLESRATLNSAVGVLESGEQH